MKVRDLIDALKAPDGDKPKGLLDKEVRFHVSCALANCDGDIVGDGEVGNVYFNFDDDYLVVEVEPS